MAPLSCGASKNMDRAPFPSRDLASALLARLQRTLRRPCRSCQSVYVYGRAPVCHVDTAVVCLLVRSSVCLSAPFVLKKEQKEQTPHTAPS